MAHSRKFSAISKYLIAALLLTAATLPMAWSKAKKKAVLKPAPTPIPVLMPTVLPSATPLPSPVPAPESLKPSLETLLKQKSIRKVTEEYDIIANSEWTASQSKAPLPAADDDDFEFVNAVLIRTPMSFARPKILDFELYPKVTSAIKKCEFDKRTGLLEVIGETHGLRMHSWIKVDQTYLDLIRYEIVRGDMVGFKISAYLYERQGKTIAVGKGGWPGARQALPTLVRLVFKPVSEIVLGVATKNFRSYIEEEYQKQKSGGG